MFLAQLSIDQPRYAYPEIFGAVYLSSLSIDDFGSWEKIIALKQLALSEKPQNYFWNSYISPILGLFLLWIAQTNYHTEEKPTQVCRSLFHNKKNFGNSRRYDCSSDNFEAFPEIIPDSDPELFEESCGKISRTLSKFPSEVQQSRSDK